MNSQTVITGVGTVSPFGTGTAAFQQALRDSRSGVAEMPASPSRNSGPMHGFFYPDFTPGSYDTSREFGRVARGAQFSIIAAEEAIVDGKLPLENHDKERVGLIFSSTRIALEKTEFFYRKLLEEGPRFLNPLAFQESVNNAPASHICIRHGLTGPSLTITSGGPGAIQAFEIGAGWLSSGRVDYVLVISAESICPISQEVNLAARGHAPISATGINECRPFDEQRNGYILGEGAVAFLLERDEQARARAASTKAVVAGSGVCHDAFRVARHHPEGRGVGRAMAQALKESSMEPETIQWLLASANSSPQGDRGEARAIHALFHTKGYQPPVSAPKAMTGETDGAAAAFNILFALTGMEDERLYPTLNLNNSDPECQLNHVVQPTQQPGLSHVMVNAGMNGGAAASLILTRCHPTRK